MLYEDRSRAESFGAVAAQYDRVRPSYPPALVDALLADGAGSVLAVAPQRARRGLRDGHRGRPAPRSWRAVLGVEVDARMAALARAKGLEVEVGRFEEWDPRGRRFDLVTSAQAWHWIDPRAGAVRAAQALRAGGLLGLFWNYGDPPPHVWDLLSPIYARLGPNVEKYSVLFGNRDARVQDTLDGLAAPARTAPGRRRCSRGASATTRPAGSPS